MYSIGEFSKIISVTRTTLRNWDKTNKLKPILLESGHRRYTDEHLAKIKNIDSNDKLNIVYCRESTKSQKKSLDLQLENIKQFCLKQGISIDKCISEFGSGLNFKRKGFLELLNLAINGRIDRLIVYYKDRLCRFGFEMFEELSKKYNFKIIVVDNTETKSRDKEFADDIIAIIHFFSMRLYGSRTYKKNLKDAEESIQKAKEEI